MVSRKTSAPDQGDVVWLDHDPQAGHEQAGRRPALVLSPRAYNAATGLMLCCPITCAVSIGRLARQKRRVGLPMTLWWMFWPSSRYCCRCDELPKAFALELNSHETQPAPSGGYRPRRRGPMRPTGKS